MTEKERGRPKRRFKFNARDKKRALRDRLFAEQGGRCHFCGCSVVVVHQHVKPPPGNLATVFHLRDRLHPQRLERPNGQCRSVLACRECANHESAERQFEQPIEELWRRSGRYPANAMELLLGRLKQHFNAS